MKSAKPDLSLELQVRKSEQTILIAGLDEAGRGALAGPVVAAAVILPLDDPERLARLEGVNDSKRLTAKRREHFYDIIIANVAAYGIGSATPIRIDNEGIIEATRRAMREALDHVYPTPDFLLIDGRIRLKKVRIPQKSIIRGDGRSISIAAASILAKVTRDRYMIALSKLYPQYGFAQHKGYATRKHVAALAKFGPLDHHRHTFAPIKQRLF